MTMKNSFLRSKYVLRVDHFSIYFSESIVHLGDADALSYKGAFAKITIFHKG